MAAGAAEPARTPSQLVPGRGLTFYLEYDGLDAHADAWKATAAWDMLNRTQAGAVITDVARRSLGRLLQMVPGSPLTGADLVALQDQLAHRGFAIAAVSDGDDSFTIFILKGFGRKEPLDRFHRLLRLVLQPGEAEFPPKPTRVRGREMYAFEPAEDAAALPGMLTPSAGPTWWLEGDTLILVRGPDIALGDEPPKPDEARKKRAASHKRFVDSVLDAIEAKAPTASTHPGVAAALAEGRDLAGFEPDGLFLVESVKGVGVLDGLRTRFGVPKLAVTGDCTFRNLIAFGASVACALQHPVRRPVNSRGRTERRALALPRRPTA
jgi:hypothetical protein